MPDMASSLRLWAAMLGLFHRNLVDVCERLGARGALDSTNGDFLNLLLGIAHLLCMSAICAFWRETRSSSVLICNSPARRSASHLDLRS